MIINLIPDTSVASAPFGFTTAIRSAATILEQAFSDSITLNIRYGWGSANNVLDMFRYDGVNHFQWIEGSSSAARSYFSIDSGQTRLADFGVYSDYSDFLNPGPTFLGTPYSNLTPNDPFNEIFDGSTLTSLTN